MLGFARARRSKSLRLGSVRRPRGGTPTTHLAEETIMGAYPFGVAHLPDRRISKPHCADLVSSACSASDPEAFREAARLQYSQIRSPRSSLLIPWMSVSTRCGMHEVVHREIKRRRCELRRNSPGGWLQGPARLAEPEPRPPSEPHRIIYKASSQPIFAQAPPQAAVTKTPSHPQGP